MTPAFQARSVSHTRWLEALHAGAEVRLPGKRIGRGQEGSDATLSQKIYFLTQPFNLETYPTVSCHMPLSSAPGPALPAAAYLRRRCLFIISFWPLTASPSFPTALPKHLNKVWTVWWVSIEPLSSSFSQGQSKVPGTQEKKCRSIETGDCVVTDCRLWHQKLRR